jgi:hypothetical protein
MTKGDVLFDGINHPDAATLLADKLIGGLLYCGTPSSTKDVTAAQYADFKAHGLWTLLCYEHTTTDIIGGRASGVNHANEFLADCRAKRIAFTEPALAAVDEHLTAVAIATAVAYQAGFRATLKAAGWTGPIGGYGFPEVLEAYHAAGIADFYFGAGSQSSQPAYVNIWQNNNTTILVGGSADDQDIVKIPLPRTPDGGIVALTLTAEDQAWFKSNLGQIVWSYKNTAAGDVADMHQALDNAAAAAASDLKLDTTQVSSLAALTVAIGQITAPNVDLTALGQQIATDLAKASGGKLTVTIVPAA